MYISFFKLLSNNLFAALTKYWDRCIHKVLIKHDQYFDEFDQTSMSTWEHEYMVRPHLARVVEY